VGRDACGEYDPLSRAQWLYGAADTIKKCKEIEAVVSSHTVAEFNDQRLTFRVDAAATSLAPTERSVPARTSTRAHRVAAPS
jgi:hypothetical protein